MSKTLTYKGFTGSVEFSSDDNLLFGEVQGIGALILYQGRDEAELEKDFRDAVDDHLDYCEQGGWDPYNPSHHKRHLAKPLKSA